MEKLRRAGEKSNGKDEREMTAKYAFKQSIPIMAGYIVFGMGFGVLLEAKGYGVLWAIAMSVFIYAGSMQYVAIDLITGGSCYGTARTSGADCVCGGCAAASVEEKYTAQYYCGNGCLYGASAGDVLTESGKQRSGCFYPPDSDRG